MSTGQEPPRSTLEHAVGEGIITAEQAEAITALRPAPPAAARRAVLPEVLGYLGGALAAIGALMLGEQVWGEIGKVMQVVILAVTTIALLGAGAMLRGRDGATGRLGGFLWFLAAPGLGATVGVAAENTGAVPDDVITVLAAASALALAALLWWLRRDALQQVATFLAAVVTLISVVGLTDATDPYSGPLVWLLGLGWLAAAFTERVPPVPVGWVLGALAVVGGPLFTDVARPAWYLIGVASAAALVVAGVRGHRPWVSVLGTAGVFITVPLTLSEFFDTTIGPLFALLVLGLALVGVAVALTRRHRETGTDH